MIQLNSVGEAIEYLARLQESPQLADLDVKFGGDLELIRIDIDGPQFHHSITGELSRGLAAYQDEIYKAAKFALLGREGRIQLTPEQRIAFELVFEVRDGTTDLLAPINTIAEALAVGLSTMEPHLLVITVIGVVLVLATGAVVAKVHSNIQETKQKKQVLDAESERQKESTNLAKTVAEQQVALTKVLSSQGPAAAVIGRFEQAQVEGVKHVVRSVPTAHSVDFGGVEFDQEDIKELRRRAPRSKSEYVEVTGNFRVFVDTNISPVRLTLSGGELPGEFHADWPDELDERQVEWLWGAIRGKSALPLEVGATIIREQVKSAVVLAVIGKVPLPTPPDRNSAE